MKNISKPSAQPTSGANLLTARFISKLANRASIPIFVRILIGIIGLQLRGTENRVRAILTKVKSGALKERFGKGMISYPDLVVICGEPEYHDKHKDIVLNPAVIIEVLSETTEEFDRGVKFMRYRNFNDTLTDYILVSQDEPHIEHYIRQKNGDWLLKEYYGLDAEFRIDSIDCSLNLKDIYDRIEFE